MRTSLVASCFMLLLGACTTDAFQGDDGGGDAAGNDASVLDVTNDVIIGSDAIASDGGKSDGAASFSCNPARAGSLLCDTFDNVPTVTTKWTASLVNSTGSVAFDTSTFVSSPKSYSSQIQQGSGQYTFAVLLFEDTSATYATMSARASIRIHAIDPSQPIPLLQLSYPSAIGNGQVTATLGALNGAFVVVYSQPSLDAGIVSSNGLPVGPHGLDTWHAVQLDFKQAPSASIKVWVDGVLAASLTPVLSAPISTSKIRDFDVGVAGTNDTDIVVNYDDIDCAGF